MSNALKPLQGWKLKSKLKSKLSLNNQDKEETGAFHAVQTYSPVTRSKHVEHIHRKGYRDFSLSSLDGYEVMVKFS